MPVAPDPSLYWNHLTIGRMILALLPFSALLLMIAVFPVVKATEAWWDKHVHKFMVAGACGIAGVLIHYLPTGDFPLIFKTFLEYLAFISLLGSLFVVSGGIHISGAFAGFPWLNTLFLGLGAILANVLGTTGASMLLIRPLIRANHHRKHKTHIIIFFIFIVGNCGGLLTPLGDPPLYLGFLRGVPFLWTFKLLPYWATTVLALLFIFHLLDEKIFEKEDLEVKGSLVDEVNSAQKTIHIQGRRNLLGLLLIMATVLVSGYFVSPFLHHILPPFQAESGGLVFQILALAAIALASYRFTPETIHALNRFSFHPISEVAILFLGIFGAMIPALKVLEHQAPFLAISRPWEYFWLSGVLSSFLDNAPTYLSFAALAAGKSGLTSDHLGILAAKAPALLIAISCGSVFMGANTYVGNGPNFMIKAIADHSHIKMPSFFGYVLWSLAILVPLFIIETLIFFL